MKSIFLLSLFLVLSATFSLNAWARPEYAAQTHIVNCATCHSSPYGGGPRNLSGKLFGTRFGKLPWYAQQSYASLDVRGQVYSVQRTPPDTSQSKGQMLMNVIPTVALPLSGEAEADPMSQIILSYSFAPVGNSMREAFLLQRFSPLNEKSWFSSVLVGNFTAPFGLLTDEHRTYTKQMVAMTNRNFESGAVLSGDPSQRVHYDFAISSGFSNGGTGVNSQPNSWATFAHIRHQVGSIPLQIGLSEAITGTTSAKENITATSLYGVFALDQYTAPVFQGNIQIEAVTAHGWNNSAYGTTAGDGIGYFIPSTASAWQTALTDSSSMGLSTLVNWDLNRRWTLQYKHEQFVPDTNFSGDYFYRNGGGFKYFFGASGSVTVRYDRGEVTRPGLTKADLAGSKAVGDTYFALLHLWL